MSAHPQKLRIATYNIHKGVSSLGRYNRIHELRSGLHSLAADIVFLQEVQGRNDWHARRFDDWPSMAQHDFLAANAWVASIYGRNAIKSGRHFSSDHGNALLSHFNIIESKNIDVSDHRFEQRGLLHVVLQINRQRVHCLCVHFGLFENSRVRQAQALVARIRAVVEPHEPLIIAGDFNDWRNQMGRQLIEQLDVHEVCQAIPHVARRSWVQGKENLPARTFPSLLPVLRLDRVYVRGFAVQSVTVMRGGDWRYLSDHLPLVVELQSLA